MAFQPNRNTPKCPSDFTVFRFTCIHHSSRVTRCPFLPISHERLSFLGVQDARFAGMEVSAPDGHLLFKLQYQDRKNLI